MALAIPLLDTCLAIGRRFLRHQPIFGADSSHIHHQLLGRGFSPRKVALLLYGVAGIAAIFSLTTSMYHNRFSGLIIILFCAAAWIGVQHLGYTEFGAAKQLFAQGTFRRILHAQLHLTSLEKKFSCALTDSDCWLVVRDAADEYGFVHVRMRIGGSVYQERFRPATLDNCWTIRIPLSKDDYLNLSHQSSAREPVLMLTLLAQVLQDNLKKRPGQQQYYAAAGN